ncbi:LysR family transcriptional regulator [Bordetella genomosp. 9]|uniref:LysR family transcriptional regulator n=1 Tax=Bordetella genomosp. 9 TaxID=1416803 RepID=UPI0018DEF229|nr:LysR family transcriptional regulator [Bordetella genomosp. 9]
MLDLNEFLTFSAVAEEKSFSRAAEKLGISKALASKHVADLEHALGVRLLHRTTRKIGLTTAGALFHERCRQLIAHAEEARHEIEQFRSAPGGLIRVSSAMAFGRRHLVPAISRFLARYPDVSIDLDLTQSFPDLVTAGADVVIRQADEPLLVALVARRLAPVRWVACASPGYLARHAAPGTPAELAGHNCLVYYVNSRGEWTFTDAAGRVHTVRPRGNFKANSADAVLHAALGDLGIGVVPTFAAGDALRSGALVQVLAGYRLPERGLYAAYLPNPTMAHSTRLFVGFLSECFGETPYWDRDLP